MIRNWQIEMAKRREEVTQFLIDRLFVWEDIRFIR
jgi:hypothetical protein